MSLILQVGIVDPDAMGREVLKTSLAQLDAGIVETECDEYIQGLQFISEQRPDIVFVGIDGDTRESIELLRDLTSQQEDCPVIAYSRSSEGTLILRAMRAGAKEFLTLPIDMADLTNAVKAVVDLNQQNGTEKRRGTTITVAGATGGVGATSVAVNLATILATDPGKSVVLVDLDIPLGDVDVLLDVAHERTLMDVADNVERLDFDLLRRSLTRLDSGLFVLPRPTDLTEAARITEASLRRVMTLLEASFSHVIIDLSKGYTPLDMLALERSDIVLLVAQLNLPSLRNCVRLLKAFEEIEDTHEKFRVVVNRCSSDQGPIRLKKAQEIIGREVFWQIPNDYRLMVEVCNNGVPLIEQAPRAEITQSLVRMAEILVGKSARGATVAAPPVETKAQSRWLNLWPTTAATTQN